MTDILTKLVALTAKDCNGLFTCPLCGKPAKASRGTHHNAQLWASCPSKLCLAGQDECTPGAWNARPREAALIALVQEAVGEISRIRQAAGHGLSALETINGRSADEYFVKTSSADVARYMKRILNPQEPTS